MSIHVIAVGRTDLAPHPMPDRFRHDVSYFMAIPGENGVPVFPAGEYWVPRADAARYLEEGVLVLVSPLDSYHRTEVELTAEQEDWLEWMVRHGVEHIRLA
ncbi:MAG: hypothetical protein SGJ19_10045 [Planctomycetia bacterium]|nr:hypothetical protein [Planctomycetia bacterium]